MIPKAAIEQALIRKLGISPEQLEAVKDGDPSILMDRVSDPGLALVMTSLLQGRAQASASPDKRDREQILQDQARRLGERLAAADAMITKISSVFGACALCWGQTPQCPQCHGRGAPGSDAPQRDEMLAWILPALKRLGLGATRMVEQDAVSA